MAPPKLSIDDTIKFIKLYKEQECLWKVDTAEYRNKNARETALMKIKDVMALPNFTIEDVKTKIKYLRATFMQELNKVKKSHKSGAVTSDMYKPTLKWYEEMASFITYNPASRGNLDNMPSSETPSISEDSQEDSGQFVKQDSTQISSTPSSGQARKRSRLTKLNNVVKDMKSLSQNFSTKDEDDEFDVFGRYIATQLRKLSTEESLCAQEEIQSIITRYRLNNLRNESMPNVSSYVHYVPQSQSSPAMTNSSSPIMLHIRKDTVLSDDQL